MWTRLELAPEKANDAAEYKENASHGTADLKDKEEASTDSAATALIIQKERPWEVPPHSVKPNVLRQESDNQGKPVNERNLKKEPPKDVAGHTVRAPSKRNLEIGAARKTVSEA